TLAGGPTWRVRVAQPAAVPRLRRCVEEGGGTAFEADLRFPYRYLIDHGLRAAVTIHGDSERRRDGLRYFHDPELEPADLRPRLRTLSLDIETTPDASRVLSYALVGCGVEEVELVASDAVVGAGAQPDERALVAKLAQRVAELDPDVLTGWNVIDFDLRVLERRARALGLSFELGRVSGPLRIERDPRFSRQPRAEIPGRMVLDGLTLVRDAFIPLEDYRLETAARTLLGRGKRIEPHAEGRAEAILRLYREDPPAFAAYNLEDARLVLEILERENLLELAIERSLLSGMQLDRVGASIASFDLLYLPALRRHGCVAPCVQARRSGARVQGGAVLDSAPGFFRNVALYDFKSLYPSLIRSFNLDPLAHAEPGNDAIVAPNGARFSRTRAILPELLEDFFARRERAKQRGDRHADLAIKIMMNALFGVLGSPACRFFDPDIANAITGLGQRMLQWTRQAFEAAGHRVLYGDTDSVFVALDPEAEEAAARAEAEELRERVQAVLLARIRQCHGVEARLELELDRLYLRFWQPRVRSGRQGSKKRYAGWADGRLELVGLEAVRRDWPPIARRLQVGLLTRAFHDEPLRPFLRQLVFDVEAGKLDEALIIRKGIRKGSLERYTATTPPHVQAARKAGGKLERVVRYVITRSGPEPVLPGAPLPGSLDYDHYVARMLRPLAEAILEPLGESFDEILGRPRQLNLL
ncbi:MAG: DNA polymerase II, partial [Myxococcota bacterium]